MSEPDKPWTHIAWSKRFRGKQFHKWVESGEFRLEVVDGVTIIHYQNDANVRGDDGYALGLPIGMKPPEPPKEPQRPQSAQNGEGE